MNGHSWPAVSLSEIFHIARGGSPRPIQDFLTDTPDGVNWIMISDASEGSKYITSTRKKIRKEGVSRSRVVKPGDFLLTNSMSFGRPYIMKTAGCIHDGWLVLEPRTNEIDPEFFYHLLGSEQVYSEFERLAAGATVKNLNIDLVSGVRVPLPPLPEQRRIAAILDQAEVLRAKRRAALSKLDTLAQSIFIEMFGDPVTNPKGWPMESLTEICHCYSGGTPSKANAELWRGDLPWFSAKDLKARDLFDSHDHISPLVTKATSLKRLPANTVAIVVRGMILAHTFPVSVLRVPAAINQDLKALLPRRPISAQFLAACLRAQKDFILKKVSEAGHGTKRLDSLALQEVRIPRVGDALELEFELRYAAIEQMKIKQAAAETQANALFASLQHRAFRGEL